MQDKAREGPGNQWVEVPPVPGTPRDRGQEAQPLGQRRSFLSNFVDKLPMLAGTVALVGAIALGSRGGNSQPNPDTSSTPRPATTDGFIPRESAVKIIDTNNNPQDAKDIVANIGSTLTLTITESSRGHIYPRLRTSPNKVDLQGPEPDNVISNQNVRAINGAPVDLQVGSEIKISNFISVPGYDADGGLGGPGGEWLALEATLNDGSKKLIYISISNQTRPNWDIKSTPSSNSLLLRQAIDQPDLQLNKTEVVR